MSKKFKLAVVGASGVVGRTVLKVLEEANLPIDEYKFFASKRSAGTTLLFNNLNSLINWINFLLGKLSSNNSIPPNIITP